MFQRWLKPPTKSSRLPQSADKTFPCDARTRRVVPAHEVLVLLLVLVPETLGLVLEEGGSAVAVAALHRVLDRFLQAWLVLRRAGEGWRF